MKIEQVFAVPEWLAIALQPVPAVAVATTVTPAEGMKLVGASGVPTPARFEPVPLAYSWKSLKYASSTVAMLRRSAFIEARYAFSFVFANFGMAMAAKIDRKSTRLNSSHGYISYAVF